MKRLKFRMRDVVRNEWLFGYKELGGFSLIGETVLMGELNGIALEDWKNIEVNQFVGLKDRSNRDIYEKDIVRFEGGNEIGVIKWNHCAWGYGLYWKGVNVKVEDHFLLLCDWIEDKKVPFEVVGNIYENPELIKEKS
jgi:uncharacterized phage protein (TIGR01671 family)